MVFSFHSFSVRLCSTRKNPYPPPLLLLPSTERKGNYDERGDQKEAIFEGVGVVSRGIFFPGAPTASKIAKLYLLCWASYHLLYCQRCFKTITTIRFHR